MVHDSDVDQGSVIQFNEKLEVKKWLSSLHYSCGVQRHIELARRTDVVDETERLPKNTIYPINQVSSFEI